LGEETTEGSGGPGQFLFLVNVDTEMDKDCVVHLWRGMESEPGTGVATPKILLYGRRTDWMQPAWRSIRMAFPSEGDDWSPTIDTTGGKRFFLEAAVHPSIEKRCSMR